MDAPGGLIVPAARKGPDAPRELIVPAARKRPDARSEQAVQRALSVFRAALRDRALKMTVVREAIVRAALGYRGHFAVEDLVAALTKSGVAEGHMTTVYRTIPLLIEAGLIQPALVSRGDGQRYESSFEREHHDHLICQKCGHVVEFRSDAIEALQREVAETHGFELTAHVHELVGSCATCRKARRSRERH